MKFEWFRELLPGDENTLPAIAKFLTKDLNLAIRSLNTGLTRLTFAENFQSRIQQVTIAANTELAIANPFRGQQVIPSYWLKLRTNEAGLDVCDGDSAWTLTTVYLKNVNTTDEAILTVAFFQ